MGLQEILKKIISARTPTSVADLERALESLDVEQAEGRALDLEQQRKSKILSASDDELAALEATIGRAWREAERVAAAREEIERRLDEAQAEEREAERRARYDEAIAAKKAAEKALRAYPKAAQQLINDVLLPVARAEAAINEANAALPKGEAEIVSAEMEVRGLPTEPSKIVKSEEFSAWCYARNPDQRVENEFLDKIKTDDGRTGTFEAKSIGALYTHRVVKRHFVKETIQESRGAHRPEPLAATIMLPGLLPGQEPIWSPTGVTSFMGNIGSDGAAMVATIEDQKTAWNQPTADPRYQITTATRVRAIDDREEEAA